jgi:hypothetical protein
VRAALAIALGKQGGPQSVNLLLEALSGGGGGLWDRDAMGAAVAEGLGRLGMRKVDGSTGETVARRLTDTVELPTLTRERPILMMAPASIMTLTFLGTSNVVPSAMAWPRRLKPIS